MLDLTNVTDELVARHLATRLRTTDPRSDAWRILGYCSVAQTRYSFSSTRTYPRPDHPDPRMRLPLVFLMVGILVSLRTTLENEQRAMAKLIHRFSTEEQLLLASEADIADCIGCAGMAEVRSVRIRKALNRVQSLPGGLDGLAGLPREKARAALLELPGFGPKAADCMLTIGLGIPSMVVDVNVFRVGSFLLGMPWSNCPDYSNSVHVEDLKGRLDSVVGDDAFLCQIVHTLLLLHGKHSKVRAHRPRSCGLGQYCRACELEIGEDDHQGRLFVA